MSFILGQNIAFCAEFKGQVEQTEVIEEELDKKLFTGEVEKLDKSATVKMTVSQVLSSVFKEKNTKQWEDLNFSKEDR